MKDRCRRTAGLLDVVLAEGDLTADELAHVADCPACARALAEARAFERELARIGHAVTPEALPVAPALLAARDLETGEERTMNRRGILTILVAGSAAAIALSTLVGLRPDIEAGSSSSPGVSPTPRPTATPRVALESEVPVPTAALVAGHPFMNGESFVAAVRSALPEDFPTLADDGGAIGAVSPVGDHVGIRTCMGGARVRDLVILDESARFELRTNPDGQHLWMDVAAEAAAPGDRAAMRAFLAVVAERMATGILMADGTTIGGVSISIQYPGPPELAGEDVLVHVIGPEVTCEGS